MTPPDPTRTSPPDATRDPSDAALDAGLAAAFGSPDTNSYQPTEPEGGTVIAGRYRLSERIGEGGMGSVWAAHQTEPVKRKVAVKLIKAGMDSKAVLARFEAERQALAVMDHPSIAKVLDGGVHAGRPYFVMELVKGVPITTYCDERKLTPAQRLELFVPVCQAIQHAHQKGVIHRDIKPSNVLVALYDDKPVPKVIDFGVAKATGAALTEHTLETGFGAVVGTPAYMSPEQASLNNLDIDTRSDVYSLGVLLYELLTGSPPFSGKELQKKGLLEMLRVVREEEPPRPSHKLSTADALPTLSANRGTEPKKLTGLLRNELDWIVMKALEKDRSRRYETANGFAADVQRYLSGEPVQAHPPSAAYRLKKFARRNRPQVIAAGLVLFALIAGVVGTTIGLLEARRQTDIAREETAAKEQARAEAVTAAEQERQAKEREAERAEGERKAKEEAERNLAFATKGNEILGSVFEGLDPNTNYATIGEFSAALRKNVQKAVRELDGAAVGDPLTVASMQHRLGASLVGLGDAPGAVVVLEKALAVFKVKLGPDHPDTLSTMSELARGYREDGKLDRALKLLEEMHKLALAKLGPDHPYTLTAMNNLAAAYWSLRQLDKSVPLFEALLPLKEKTLGRGHPETVMTVANLGVNYMDIGRVVEALPLLEEAFEWQKAKIGPDHPDTLGGMLMLAKVYQNTGRVADALSLLEEAHKRTKARLGPDHPHTLRGMSHLAGGYLQAGRPDRALPLFDEALQLSSVKFGRDHLYTLISMDNLAGCYRDYGKLDRALPLLEEILRHRKAKLGLDHPDTLISMGDLGKAYCETKQGEKAAAVLKDFTTAKRKQYPNDSPPFAGLLAEVSLDLLRCGQFAAAEPLLRECLAIRKKAEPEVWTTFNTQSMLGGALLGQKKYADAEPLLLKGYEGMKAREDKIPKVPQAATRIPEALDRLVELYTAVGKPEEAAKYRGLRSRYREVLPPPRVEK